MVGRGPDRLCRRQPRRSGWTEYDRAGGLRRGGLFWTEYLELSGYRTEIVTSRCGSGGPGRTSTDRLCPGMPQPTAKAAGAGTECATPGSNTSGRGGTDSQADSGTDRPEPIPSWPGSCGPFVRFDSLTQVCLTAFFEVTDDRPPRGTRELAFACWLQTRDGTVYSCALGSHRRTSPFSCRPRRSTGIRHSASLGWKGVVDDFRRARQRLRPSCTTRCCSSICHSPAA